MSTTDQKSISKKTSSISVYFLAAPEDEQQCMAIKKYLAPVIRNSKVPIEIHSDFEIPPGEDINEYKLKLYEADIVLAFISADFINDDQTYIRTQKVINRYNNNETIMLPILVRNCMWKSTPFVNLPLLPKNTQPLNNKHFWNSEDDALTSVVNDINESIQEFTYEEAKETPAKVKDDKVEQSEQVNEQVEALETKMVEETPVRQETIKEPMQSLKQKMAYKKKTQIPLDIDWRKKYQRTTFWKRGLAFFLDQILTFFPIYFIYLIIEIAIIGADDYYEPSETSFIIFFIVYFSVCAAFESSKYRATFGKLIMKLEISNRHGDRIGFFKAFWRNILRWVIAYSYILIIPLIIQYFTYKKYKKLFHDQVSHTVVGERIKR